MMKQMKITDCTELTLTPGAISESCDSGCHRFFTVASMLPADTTLGLRFTFRRGEEARMTAFSDAALSAEDHAWMFAPCAAAAPTADDGSALPADALTYRIFSRGSFDSCVPVDFDTLNDELSALGAELTVLAPSGADYARLTLRTAQPLPLRVRAMLSDAFRCAELAEVGPRAEEDAVGLPRPVAEQQLAWLMFRLAEKHVGHESVLPEDDFEISELYDGASTPLEELQLGVRIYRCLNRAGIYSVEQLYGMDEDALMRVRNLGRKGCEEVLRRLAEYAPEETPVKAGAENERSGNAQLDELIGLDGVKAQVRRMAALARMKQDFAEAGRRSAPITLNMAFTGNPGTAKTTVARIMAKLFCEIGLIREPEPLEVGRADLVASYEGQTADKVRNVFRRAAGRLLLIDEAYSLLEEAKNSFGDEAINTIVQEMENHRAETVVVFTGYPAPMEELLARNPGLRSRVPFRIDFADYSPEEMTRIAVLNAEQRGFSVDPEALTALDALCAEAHGGAENGNGRFCRNVIESAVLSYAERVYGDGTDAERDCVLRVCDFHAVPTVKKQSARRIGFCA